MTRTEGLLRRALGRVGIRFRRFPLWLHIFNLLCAATALTLLAVSAWVLYGPEPARPLIVDGRLNREALRARLEAGAEDEVVAELAALPAASRRALLQEVGASSEPRAALVIRAFAEAEPALEPLLAPFRRAWPELDGEALRGELAQLEGGREALRWEQLLYGTRLARELILEAARADARAAEWRALARGPTEEAELCAAARRRIERAAEAPAEVPAALLAAVAERLRSDGGRSARVLEAALRVGLEWRPERVAMAVEGRGARAWARWLGAGPGDAAARAAALEALPAGLRTAAAEGLLLDPAQPWPAGWPAEAGEAAGALARAQRAEDSDEAIAALLAGADEGPLRELERLAGWAGIPLSGR